MLGMVATTKGAEGHDEVGQIGGMGLRRCVCVCVDRDRN